MRLSLSALHLSVAISALSAYLPPPEEGEKRDILCGTQRDQLYLNNIGSVGQKSVAIEAPMTNETSGHTVSDSRILRFCTRADEATRGESEERGREERSRGEQGGKENDDWSFGTSAQVQRRDENTGSTIAEGIQQRTESGGGIVELGIGGFGDFGIMKYFVLKYCVSE